MSAMFQIIKDQFLNFKIIRRMAKYDDRATYQSHYLGLAWEFLNPLIQIGIYYLVFGVALKRGDPAPGVPYLPWMVLGIAPWLYMNKTTLDASRSVYQQVGLVSKMKFPVSVLPSIKIYGNLYSYWTMMAFGVFLMFTNGIYVSISWIQFIYYFICMIALMFAVGIFNSTVSVLIRDWHITLQSILRMLFYMSGVLFNFTTSNFPAFLVRLLELNPFYYVLNGMRESLLNKGWIWQQPNVNLTIVFWLFVLIVMIVGSYLHNKFRSHFVDLI
ncbi:ABC transporter permease [Pediococcus acidilactici]|jgi:teichoic acid transport system permease protein|uniref:ABC transporter permease n=1 Tax=Pediococcus acidilactici TaxID=1254 RepID=UPI001313D3CC|nr:ABC transporter permease [Pediococcus acidilactici]KAF0340476.1 Teichoic acid translocation permease TagG [Pediococcus acidilactici]KAF0352396.1 Teichoic acid translocation permease TagG [Pediococcus acidilactici]KAF0356231.1 Teichoic acid translocation permease TagG [Pediococcus acidilactici]KAF0360848.1 Teichoic acid translocation permease TagG [Pediococcus acidilactici]KAF0374424.1 Teichoic acid translocation permease TagG [Pediococcus acidilactici]